MHRRAINISPPSLLRTFTCIREGGSRSSSFPIRKVQKIPMQQKRSSLHKKAPSPKKKYIYIYINLTDSNTKEKKKTLIKWIHGLLNMHVDIKKRRCIYIEG